MILKELSATCREKFLNTSYLTVLALAILAELAEGFKLPQLRKSFILKARERYWIYVRERQKEFDVAVAQWEGVAIFGFVIKRYTARGVHEIKSVSIRADAMHEAQARLLSYNHGPGFAIISKASNFQDTGIWAEITNAKEEFLPASEQVPFPPEEPQTGILLEVSASVVQVPAAVSATLEKEEEDLAEDSPLGASVIQESKMFTDDEHDDELPNPSAPLLVPNTATPPSYARPGRPSIDRILKQSPIKQSGSYRPPSLELPPPPPPKKKSTSKTKA